MKTTYEGFKKLRAESNSSFIAFEDEANYLITLNSSLMNGLTITTILDTLSDDPAMVADVTDYRSNLATFANKPVLESEIRFYTHDFADASTWHSKTCGDAAAPYVGGHGLHPLSGLWMNPTGAAMMTAYSTPGDPHCQDPSYLYGSLAQHITAQYDDINYRWVDNLANSYLNNPTAAPFTTYCYLDLRPTYPAADGSVSTAVWRDPALTPGADGTGNIICHFDPTLGPDQVTNAVDAQGNPITKKRGSWMCTPQGGGTPVDATSSRWRIDAYDNKKIQLRKAGMSCELTAVLPEGRFFRWKPYGKPSPAQIAQLEAMGLDPASASLAEEGVEYVYHTISDFRFGCNDYSQSGVPEPNCKTVTVNMTYDYTQSVMPIIDATQSQRLDITIDEHMPVEVSQMARGTFLAVEYPAF